MRVYYGIDEYAAETSGARVALGFFDGVHLGHRAVLSACVNGSDGKAVALTFSQSPAAALGRQAPPLLTDNSRKAELMAELGIDAVIFADFGELRDMSAEDFVRVILRDRLRASEVCCGENYHFGRGGSGDAGALRELCAREGIGVCVVGPEMMGGEAVSSTRIRGLLARGDIGTADSLLGYRWAVRGVIGRGNGIGSVMGYPTVNLPVGEGLCAPRYGVYASIVTVGGVSYRAATNIGVHPTVGEADALLCESYLIDYRGGELYGERAVCEPVEFIRPEMRFADERELRERIGEDIAWVKSCIFP